MACVSVYSKNKKQSNFFVKLLTLITHVYVRVKTVAQMLYVTECLTQEKTVFALGFAVVMLMDVNKSCLCFFFFFLMRIPWNSTGSSYREWLLTRFRVSALPVGT